MELRRRRSCQSGGPSPSFCPIFQLCPRKTPGKKWGCKSSKEERRKPCPPSPAPLLKQGRGPGDSGGGSCTHHSHHIFNSLWGVERAGRQVGWGGGGKREKEKRLELGWNAGQQLNYALEQQEGESEAFVQGPCLELGPPEGACPTATKAGQNLPG